MASGTQDGFVLTGRHVLFGLIAFFGVVFAVNAYFVDVALSTNTGVVANEPYRKGLKYNERIEASERQTLLGWKEAITLADSGKRLVVEMSDQNQRPLTNLKIQSIVGRPATTVEDQTVSLTETAPGRYESALKLAGAGAFLASIEVESPGGSDQGIIYRARKRLWLEQ